MDRATLTKHWHWETDRDGLAWLTFDKQGESANTFSREALEQLRAALDEIRRVVSVFRELRSGVTGDGRTKIKTTTGTLSTAEAISVMTSSRRPSEKLGTHSTRAAR